MKRYQNPKLIRSLAAVVAGFALLTGTLHGAPFLYNPGDLVLAIRQTGGASDYVVNIGKATNYSTLPAGTTLIVSNLSISQLTSAFPSVNELQWSVAAASRPPGVAGFPLQTLWVTAPRLDAGTPAAPWLRKGQFIQGNAGSQIDAVGYNAGQASSILPGGPDNTVTGVVIPVNHSYAIGPVIGIDGNYVGNFQGDVETLTDAAFDSDPNNVSRADLYELLPGTSASGTLDTPGRYLGYFELKPNGSLTFNTTVPPPPAPVITSVVRIGNVTTVSFTTVANATYRLRTAGAPGASVSTWTTGGTSVSGNGSVQTLQDTSSADARFFAVEAQSQ